MEQKNADKIKLPKLDKNNWAKAMEAIMINLRIAKGLLGFLLGLVAKQHVKVVHIAFGYSTGM